LKEAMDSNVVGYNTKGRLMYIPTGEEIPANFGRGGMKAWVLAKAQETAGKGSGAAMMANVGTITFDDGSAGYGRLGESDGVVRTTSLGGENQWIMVDVEEKRKRGGLDQSRRVKPRTGDESQPTDEARTAPESQSQSHLRPAAFGYPPPVHMEEVPDESVPHDIGRSQPATAPIDRPRFRLASELNQTITAEDVGKKIMEADVQLRMCELLAVSPGVVTYFHDQTRKRRIPLGEVSSASAEDNVISADSNLAQVDKSLYAVPSPRAKVVLDEEVQVEALLDDGSELNLMGKEIFEKLGHPLDSDISWRINGYDSGAEKELEELGRKKGVLGVCHEVSVDVGGVVVKQHIFVVTHLASTDLILGRPWERMVRAQKTNMDDGSYRVKIRSLDGKRVVEFLGVPAQHERIREYVRTTAADLKEQGVRR
jgi:hypothetical protein